MSCEQNKVSARPALPEGAMLGLAAQAVPVQSIGGPAMSYTMTSTWAAKANRWNDADDARQTVSARPTLPEGACREWRPTPRLYTRPAVML